MEREKLDFLLELESYARQGIPILLEGCISTPEEVFSTCLLKEESAYMCDYIFCEEGKVLREVHFDRVNNYKE